MMPQVLPAPQAATSGLYVGDFDATTIYGYRARNPRNKPPVCTVPGVSYVNGLAVDGKGDLIDPDGGTRKVIVFKGPEMCGATLASLSDPYGMPSDAASADAASGAIVVGNIFDGPTQSSDRRKHLDLHGCGRLRTEPHEPPYVRGRRSSSG